MFGRHPNYQDFVKENMLKWPLYSVDERAMKAHPNIVAQTSIAGQIQSAANTNVTDARSAVLGRGAIRGKFRR